MSKPNIKVSDGTWRRLNAMKQPGDTFDDVLQRLLSQADNTPPDAVAES